MKSQRKRNNEEKTERRNFISVLMQTVITYIKIIQYFIMHCINGWDSRHCIYKSSQTYKNYLLGMKGSMYFQRLFVRFFWFFLFVYFVCLGRGFHMVLFCCVCEHVQYTLRAVTNHRSLLKLVVLSSFCSSVTDKIRGPPVRRRNRRVYGSLLPVALDKLSQKKAMNDRKTYVHVVRVQVYTMILSKKFLKSTNSYKSKQSAGGILAAVHCIWSSIQWL